MAKANFFLAGFPKCGTTAVWHNLDQHPEVFMSKEKEPNFFCKDVIEAFEKLKATHPKARGVRTTKAYRHRSVEAYEGLFQNRSEKILGDSSVGTYSYSHTAPEQIKDYNPNAKILFIVREPVNMIASRHNHRAATHFEVEDLREVLTQEKEHEGKDDKDQFFLTPPVVYSYFDLAKYADAIKRYQKQFPENQVKVMVYEDFKKDPLQFMKGIYQFLEIDATFIPKTKIVNESRNIKTAWAHSVVRTLKIDKLSPLLPTFIKKAWRSFRAGKGRKDIDPELRAKLKQNLLPEVEKLSKLLNRDLVKEWDY